MALNTIAGNIFHGWHISGHNDTPGLRENLPIPKGNNFLRIFGNIPSGVTVENLIHKAKLDLDNFSYIDVIIHHPGVKMTLIATNADGEKRFDIKLGDNTNLVIGTSHEKFSETMAV